MTPLQQAAQALVDRWDTPLWKDAPHTGKYIDALRAALSAPAGWQAIETAPRGSGKDGPQMTTHPDYVAPPELLLKHADGIAVGCYEWYYHPGYGRGADINEPVWRSCPDYSGLYEVTHWMPLPAAPSPQEQT